MRQRTPGSLHPVHSTGLRFASMLTQLSIRHYAIVDALDIEFQPGMTVITGETGAGKSIMLGALGLAMGDRADKGVISSNASRADISASFDTADQPLARAWLQENELWNEDEPDLCLLRRVVADDGRSRAWVNGFPVTLQVLKEIGEMLIDIHSQHEHQSLLNRATHLRLLDEFLGETGLRDDVRRLSRDWRRNQEQLDALRQRSLDASAQVALLGFQLEELNELDLQDGELTQLQVEYRNLSSADSMLATARQVLEVCSESDEQNLLSGLHHALSLLHVVSHDDDREVGLEFGDQFLDFEGGDGIEGGAGFVHQEDFGSNGDGAGDAQSLLLAAGEAEAAVMEPVLAFVPEGGGAQTVLHGFIEHGFTRFPGDAQAIGDVLVNRLGKGVGLLKDHADAAAEIDDIEVSVVDIGAADADFPAGDLGPGDDVIHAVQAAQ